MLVDENEFLVKIAHVFSINHDGVIIKLEQINSSLNIQVDIQYLASVKNSQNRILNLKLLECSNFKFVDFIDNNKIYRDIKKIQEMELSILTAEVKEKIIVVGVFWNDECPYGELQFSAKDILIFDQDGVEIEYMELIAMVTEYWGSLAKK
jgi:hypothetical protein